MICKFCESELSASGHCWNKRNCQRRQDYLDGVEEGDAETARLKVEVERQELTIEALHVEHERAEARWKRALAAGPAALRKQAGRVAGSQRAECLTFAADAVDEAQRRAIEKK